MNTPILAALFAGLASAMGLMVIINAFSAVSARYKEKYLQETAVVMEL